MNPKSVFLEDKELVKWWVVIVRDSRFSKVAALALASLSTHPEKMPGAVAMLDMLEALPDPDFTSSPFPSPGLVHETPKRITDQPKTEKPKA